MPANAPRVTWEVTETDSKARDGAAIRKRVVGRMGDRPDAPRMNLTVFLPARANGPVPVLLSITFGFGAGGRGPAAGKAAASKKGEGTAKPAGGPGGFDPVGEVLDRGWGYATLSYADIQPDRADRWTEGVIGLTLEARARRGPRPTSGGRSAPGPGASAGRSTTSRPTQRSTRSRSPSRASRGWARPSSGPVPRTSAWRPCSRSSPARWARP